MKHYHCHAEPMLYFVEFSIRIITSSCIYLLNQLDHKWDPTIDDTSKKNIYNRIYNCNIWGILGKYNSSDI